VGIGIYLPLEVVVTIACGGLVGWLTERRLPAAKADAEAPRRRGVLLASGFLVGESIVGVLLATLDTLLGRSSGLVLSGPGALISPTWLGLIVFLSAMALFYRLVVRAR
jgi:hypothetical protein